MLINNAIVGESTKEEEMEEVQASLQQAFVKELDHGDVQVDFIIKIEGRSMMSTPGFTLNKDQREAVTELAPIIRLMSPMMFDKFMAKL